MLNEVQQTIIQHLTEVYPEGYTIYKQYIPQTFQKPYFLITIVKQSYNKRMGNIYDSLISFDISYSSDKNEDEIMNDCQQVQEELVCALFQLPSYKVVNLSAQITENILHITFDIRYSKRKDVLSTKMQQLQTNTNF